MKRIRRLKSLKKIYNYHNKINHSKTIEQNLWVYE